MVYQDFVGRPFLWGVRDCYEMLVDVYRESFGIELTRYARPTDWRSENNDLIRRVYNNDGFEMITDWKAKDLRPGDILCMAVGESAPNHMAIFVGDNSIVHHLWGRLSTIDLYRDYFRNTTCFVLRHPDVPDLRQALPTTDVRNLLRERYDLQPAV